MYTYSDSPCRAESDSAIRLFIGLTDQKFRPVKVMHLPGGKIIILSDCLVCYLKVCGTDFYSHNNCVSNCFNYNFNNLLDRTLIVI